MMTNETKLTLKFLNPAECSFAFNENGFICFTLKGESLGRVKLIRTYPYSLADEYICVHNLEDTEYGIIKALSELDKISYDACTKELESRYYCPTVTKIKSIKERMGHFYFETVIDGKDKSFTVRDITRNLRYASEDTLLIFDMDGNRYIIPQFSKTEDKSKRLLEPYLY